MISVWHCCTHPGTGICMCDCHDADCACDDAGKNWIVYQMRGSHAD